MKSSTWMWMIAVNLLATLILAAATQSAQAQTFTVLHNFTGGGDGAAPLAGLTRDAGGNFYGTAYNGGYTGGTCAPYGCGTVFKLSNKGSGWVLTPLYSFQGSNDGAYPSARVILGPDGSLYGTTGYGGSSGCRGTGCGTVFNLRPQAAACKTALCPWSESVLYRFMEGGNDYIPGPGDLVFDQRGNIYGSTTQRGGFSCGGSGAVYELVHSGSGWTERALYSFGGGSDGGCPNGGVIFDHAGNLYGTSVFGGGGGAGGTVFELTPSGPGWAENTLYALQNGSDGESAYGGLLFDGSGNLFGSTSTGGQRGGGTVFELSYLNGSWKFILLYSLAGGGGSEASLAMDAAGNLYGTAINDGTYGEGSVFRLTPSGGGWTYTSLHDFSGGSDGGYPWGSVTLDVNGHLYGTTQRGGLNNLGVVWEITP
jgi:uncharacterized repeat protein (TIGR03803 family)